jgi:hypothetical protein
VHYAGYEAQSPIQTPPFRLTLGRNNERPRLHVTHGALRPAGRARFDSAVKFLPAGGHSANALAAVTVEQSAERFVVKPFDMRQLLTAVRKALDER